MGYSASGTVSLAQDYARATLADCDAFRTLVGATGATAQAQALARIYHAALPPPDDGDEHTLAELQGYRPFVIVHTDPNDGYGFEINAVGTQHEFADYGEIWLTFEVDVPSDIAEQPSEIDLWANNTIGGIVDDLKDLAGQNGYLAITHGRLAGYFRSDANEIATQGDYIVWILSLSWRM